MEAFIGTVITKEEIVKELKKHQELDSFIKGTYGELNSKEFKGCAVGCSLESIGRLKQIDLDIGDHQRYEDLLGIPEWLARVEDTIFEGLNSERSKSWPVEFIEAINVSSDLDKIKPSFLIFILESNLERLKDDKFKEQRDAILGSINLWKRDDIGSKEWEDAARSAAESARSAAESAYSAYSAESAYSAAESAYSAYSARSAAESAARSARSAESAARSARSARSAAYEKFANELLKLIKENK